MNPKDPHVELNCSTSTLCIRNRHTHTHTHNERKEYFMCTISYHVSEENVLGTVQVHKKNVRNSYHGNWGIPSQFFLIGIFLPPFIRSLVSLTTLRCSII